MIPPKPIISISRRTDVPAYYSRWLQTRLAEGWVEVLHPYSRKLFRLELGVEAVSALVFWSKNFGPFLDLLPFLKTHSYPFTCLYTITGLPSAWEPRVPPLEQSIDHFKKLAGETSPHRIQWRYDPIIFSPTLTFQYHLERFDFIASRLSGFTHRCIVSFVNRYRKIEKRVKESRLGMMDPPLEEKFRLLKELVEIGQSHKIDLFCCCDDSMQAAGIGKSRCVDPEILSQHCGVDISRMVFSPTRKDCGCVKSVDIGFYDTCPHGCVYCYANSHTALVNKRWEEHDPTAGTLIQEQDIPCQTQKPGTEGRQMKLFDTIK